MRIAVLADIHGNWEALIAVLRDASEQGVTHYACAGDIVGYNADPVRCLEWLHDLECLCVRGNHDHYCAHTPDTNRISSVASAALTWTIEQLNDEHRRYLANLPLTAEDSGFSLVHNTLAETNHWHYVFSTDDAAASFKHQRTKVCFHGHTHIPLVFRKRTHVTSSHLDRLEIQRGATYFVNVGSVGQPRDHDPRAGYALYDIESSEVRLRRVTYDVRRAQEKILRADLPPWLAERLALGA